MDNPFMNKIFALMMVAAIMLSGAFNAEARKKPQAPQLTEQGKQLEKSYQSMMDQLRKALDSELPNISTAAQSSYERALEGEAKAKQEIASVQKGLGEVGKAKGLVGHATGHWIPKAKRGIAASEKAFKAAKTDAERDKAKKELANWKQNLKDGEDALKERTAKYEKAKRNKPMLDRKLAAAKKDLERAQARVASAMKTLRTDRVLTTDKLDGKLAKFVVMHQAKPVGLAAYAQQGDKQAKLVDRLLKDEALMVEMLLNGGAQDGNFGKAVEIYDAILAKYPKAKQDGTIFNELALGVALEHATPRTQRNAKADVNAPQFVDPIARYAHYEKAYLDGELDPYFDTHIAWELRHVVNGEEPDHVLAWGREMLRNYRPDHITTGDDRWRYVALVRTCIRYGSQENKNDKDELHFFQNILMNGGICGRRAFIGRFILRSFGVPTVAKPQPGHAALGRWTPEGWVAVLGAGWNTGWAPSREMAATDFLAMTQARELEDYIQVQRAFWVGDLKGEQRKIGFDTGKHKAGFWSSVALNKQKMLIEQSGAKAIAAVGEELGEANTSKVKYPFESAKVDQADRKVSVDAKGVITIPAAATSNPTKSTGKIRFLDSVLGGKQLTYQRNGGEQDFSYTFDAPRAGDYELTMKLATPSWKQGMKLVVNGAKPIDMVLPHTVGLWETTKPVTIKLKKGENKITFTRKGIEQEVAAKGFTIKHYTLTPVSGSISSID